MIWDLYAGPGGWDEAARMLGLTNLVGIELDEAACRTRAAAGHQTIRADVSAFPVAHLTHRIQGLAGSPPCTMFSGAGSRAAAVVMHILAEGIRDAFALRPTRARRRREMAHALRIAEWPKTPKARPGAKPPRKLTRAGRSAKIRAAVVSASQVIEPARFIAASNPEWVALEQVPEVLPLWRVYAKEMRARGYSVWCGKLNAADYGVPQTRERAILIASRLRTVRRPEPTHYDPRKGMQLWGTPWVSMAEALGFGATARPAPVVTSGGTATGGAEPFGHRDRDMLSGERTAGRWALHSAHREKVNDRTRPRELGEPAHTIAFGHSDMRWKFRNNNNNACVRSPDEPAGTLFFGHRSNWAAWVRERPATTVMGDPRIGRPGHKGRENGGEPHFAVDSVRITVEEAAILQSFPAGYPWQGTKTRQYEQVGNAWCPRAAAAVIGEATGIAWQPLVAAYYGDEVSAA